MEAEDTTQSIADNQSERTTKTQKSEQYYQLEHGPTVKVSVLEEIGRELRDSGKTLDETFRSYDKDGSKSLSEAEFKTMVSQLCPQMKDSDTKQLFKAADRNKDKTISLEEFVQTFGKGIGKDVIGDYKKPGQKRGLKVEDALVDEEMAGDCSARGSSGPRGQGSADSAADQEGFFGELMSCCGMGCEAPAGGPP